MRDHLRIRRGGESRPNRLRFEEQLERGTLSAGLPRPGFPPDIILLHGPPVSTQLPRVSVLGASITAATVRPSATPVGDAKEDDHDAEGDEDENESWVHTILPTRCV